MPLDTGQPTERHLMTVIRSRRGEDRAPHICMSGKWLARAGFASGSRIAVEATAGKLVITVVSPPGPMPARESQEAPPWSWKPARRLKHGYSWDR
ncbi:MAG TPA: SymE family type I addiction module toxin [Thermoanaerobaculia bacterium]|nr:SymE family type I addiction module toxin [Thermoanaerobaculia bacterium]